MLLYLLALNPTDSVTQGFLPAAARLGLSVTVLTDSPAPHQRAYARLPSPPDVLKCDVREFREVVSLISTRRAPNAVFTNSDHLQTQAALAADYFGLPAKNWKATLRAKDKGLLRRHLARCGLDTVWSAELAPGEAAATLTELDVPLPCVVKPREGVASEDVELVDDMDQLVRCCEDVRRRRPGAALVVEEFLVGEQYTLETLGDGTRRHVVCGFRAEPSPPPYFIDAVYEFVPTHPPAVLEQVLAQLDELGVGLGACHTEFIVQADARARIIEVNYRAVGDQTDLMMADLLEIPYFEYVLGVHLGRPLPADLGARTDMRMHNLAVCADRAGTLTEAPGPSDLVSGGVRLSYRPVRALGERHEHYHSNRDFLGLVWAMGQDEEALRRAAAEFVAANRWEITP
ncbi:ATP-grasp domain-containing protein [Streptomyces sp. NPDC097981]|uniref:ATP-grasp domain-containing protein n=1 Tax=Streptomyces sp. NPDC097981 TaxID=3155428 RepID=UPI00331B0888